MKYRRLAILFFLLTCVMCGCTQQSRVRSLGEDMELHLEPNQKLEEITWKNDSLWYLTKPMTEDDVAETHTFQQSSSFGFIEGSITIIETKADEKMVKEYIRWAEEYPMSYDEYLNYKKHGYKIEDILNGRVDYSILYGN